MSNEARAIDLFDLTGRVAVVTGGSRGLGREMVMALAQQGADVVIASRKIENCQAVAREVEAIGRRALPFAYHAADWDGAGVLAEVVYSEFGRARSYSCPPSHHSGRARTRSCTALPRRA